jgi:bifunctional DNase/RNase
MMQSSAVELEVRGVRMPANQALAAVALVGRRGTADGRVLSLQIGVGDAHSLHHELHGHETTRSQAVSLAGRLVGALGGRLKATRLVAEGPNTVTAVVEIETPTGSVEVPAEPGQALATAVHLGLPLLGDPVLFPPRQSRESVLTGPIAAFLDSLDLRGLGEPPP